LAQQIGDEVPMTFEEFERIIGQKLPPSAHKRNEWWTNNADHHSQAKAWLSAGFEAADVVRKAKKLIFKRMKSTKPLANGMEDATREFKHAEPKSRRHPLIGAMKGTFTIEPGFDLTSPMFDPDELAEWEANLDRTADMIEEGMSRKRR
jgi:hypothetical protein